MIQTIFKKLCRKMCIPIIMEFPFFLSMVILFNFISLSWIIRHPSELINIWEYWVECPRICFFFITTLYSFLFSAVVYYTKISIVKVLLYIIASFLVILNVFLHINFDVLLSPNILMLVMETNAKEIESFAYTFFLSYGTFVTFFVLILILFFLYLFEKQRRRIICYLTQKTRFRTLLEMVVLFFFCVSLVFVYDVVELFRCQTLTEMENWETRTQKSTDLLTNFMFCSWNLKLSSKLLPKAEQSTSSVNNTNHQLLWKNDNIDVILVIGESYIKSHSMIYGYKLKTTPRMEKEKEAGRLFALTDVVTPFIYTSESVRNILSTNSIGDKEQWYEFPFFPAIFKKAGYNVMFWDNQYDPLSIYTCDFSLNSYLHSPVITSLSYDIVRPFISMYDADLVADYRHYCLEHQISNPTFTIFHLQGQHFSTEERYPQIPEFQHFTVDSIHRSEEWITNGKKQVIAHYDNCTLYNDFVLDQIISIFRDRCSVLVYLSDHGEDIYDTGDVLGRSGNSLQLYEIPFMIWCSDKYKEQHGDIVESIIKSVNKPLMSDNLCHLLFRLGGVSSPYYNDSRDVLSPYYQCPSRIIGGSRDYDLLKQQKKE